MTVLPTRQRWTPWAMAQNVRFESSRGSDYPSPCFTVRFMKHLFSIVICVIVVSWSSVKAQESALRQLASRTELHTIQTLTLSDEQFLSGQEAGAKPVTVAGQLRI